MIPPPVFLLPPCEDIKSRKQFCFSAVQKRWSTRGGRGAQRPLRPRGRGQISPPDLKDALRALKPKCGPPSGAGSSSVLVFLCPALAHSWCTMLSAWLMDTGPSWRRRRHWKVVLSVPTSTSSFSCSLANSMNTCRTQRVENVGVG